MFWIVIAASLSQARAPAIEIERSLAVRYVDERLEHIISPDSLGPGDRTAALTAIASAFTLALEDQRARDAISLIRSREGRSVAMSSMAISAMQQGRDATATQSLRVATEMRAAIEEPIPLDVTVALAIANIRLHNADEGVSLLSRTAIQKWALNAMTNALASSYGPNGMPMAEDCAANSNMQLDAVAYAQCASIFIERRERNAASNAFRRAEEVLLNTAANAKSHMIVGLYYCSVGMRADAIRRFTDAERIAAQTVQSGDRHILAQMLAWCYGRIESASGIERAEKMVSDSLRPEVIEAAAIGLADAGDVKSAVAKCKLMLDRRGQQRVLYEIAEVAAKSGYVDKVLDELDTFYGARRSSTVGETTPTGIAILFSMRRDRLCQLLDSPDASAARAICQAVSRNEGVIAAGERLTEMGKMAALSRVAKTLATLGIVEGAAPKWKAKE